MIATMLAAVVAVQTAGAGGAFEIPAAFRGAYDTRLADCGGVGSDGRLLIDRTSVHFAESTGNAHEVLILGRNDIVVMADFAGEGERWSSMTEFTLSADGRALTATAPGSADAPQSQMLRLRCSARR